MLQLCATSLNVTFSSLFKIGLLLTLKKAAWLLLQESRQVCMSRNPWVLCGCCTGATRLNVMQCNLLTFAGYYRVKWLCEVC